MAQKEFLSFEISLFKSVYKDEQLISPYATGICLAYLANLVKFEITRDDIIKLLHSTPKKYWSYFEMILNMNKTIESNNPVRIANILFCEKKQMNSTFFLEENTSENDLTSKLANYMPETVSINILLDSVPSLINKTIKKRTNGVITNLMNPQMPRGVHDYVVMSSILSFECKFRVPFQNQSLHQFHGFPKINFQNNHIENSNYLLNCQANSIPNNSNSKKDKNMIIMLSMQGKRVFVSKTHQMKMVLLPFEGDKTSFVAIMPKKKGESYFKKMMRKLNQKRFLDLIHRKVLKTVDLVIPMINVETDSLNCFDQIKKLGLNADSFSFDSNEILTHFRQKCVFSLNKFGTVQKDNSFEIEEKIHGKPSQIKFNRPFIYFVFSHNPEVVLLSGVFMNV
ncbi:hypothetical protein M9Y10_002279 [Tritrichomonas musculus]|uniref:Serpin domain-containing protein n=1 Tax=Tritrichomonas musculus TaxID=1915356 RepID=A0ABR2LAC8_9EUKA